MPETTDLIGRLVVDVRDDSPDPLQHIITKVVNPQVVEVEYMTGVVQGTVVRDRKCLCLTDVRFI